MVVALADVVNLAHLPVLNLPFLNRVTILVVIQPMATAMTLRATTTGIPIQPTNGIATPVVTTTIATK